MSDSGVAGACALAAAEGAALNVRINLPSITDARVAREFAEAQERLIRRATELAGQIRSTVDTALNETA